MVLKGYKITDTGECIITIQYSGIYKIKSSGNIFEGSGEVKVKDFEDLVKLNPKNSTKCIRHKETGEELSESEYLEKEKELLSKRHYDSEEYTHNWESLDDEFNYRKFIASYERVNETFYEEEEVIVEEIKEVLLETKHPFITSKFSTQGELSDICTYNKYGAYKAILREKMKEIGAEEVPDTAFGSDTDGKLAWSNPTHSCIRYTKFAGDYLFSDGYDVKYPKTGKFEELVKEYEQDRENIRKIIHDKYLLKFGKFDEAKTPIVLQAVKDLNNVWDYLWKVSSTKKTEDSLRRARNIVKEVKEKLNSTFEL